MEESNQESCQCEKASCGCNGSKVEPCACGEPCACNPGCRCAGGCACAETK